MLFYTGFIFLVIAVSLDGFGVGVTYGIRKIHIPPFPLLIIMFCSGFIVLLSMTIGGMLSHFISPDIANIIGGLILIFLGLFSLFNIMRADKKKDKLLNKQKRTTTLNSVKTVFSTPDKADLDDSGVISANEAVLLGSALALDAFGAGLGASMLGYSPIMTTISIALMSGLFVHCGIRVGLFLSRNRHLQQMTFIPPLLLIALGIYNLF